MDRSLQDLGIRIQLESSQQWHQKTSRYCRVNPTGFRVENSKTTRFVGISEFRCKPIRISKIRSDRRHKKNHYFRHRHKRMGWQDRGLGALFLSSTVPQSRRSRLPFCLATLPRSAALSSPAAWCFVNDSLLAGKHGPK
jgi:hypothetical protein